VSIPALEPVVGAREDTGWLDLARTVAIVHVVAPAVNGSWVAEGALPGGSRTSPTPRVGGACRSSTLAAPSRRASSTGAGWRASASRWSRGRWCTWRTADGGSANL
jgi:hypothetical protein